MNATIIHQGSESTVAPAVAPAEATPDALWLPLPDLAGHHRLGAEARRRLPRHRLHPLAR